VVAMTTSALDDATLTAMRAEAEAGDRSPFIDPALLREAEALIHLANDEWLARVLGHTVDRYQGLAAWRYLTQAELALTVRAINTDRAHLEAVAAERRAAQERVRAEQATEAAAARQAERDGWEALRARLPVPVQVCHNWTARHLDGYEQGADHIVVMADLHARRLHRTTRSPLCWTPSRAHELRHVTPNVGDDERIPDCKACLRHAERLAAISPPQPKEAP